MRKEARDVIVKNISDTYYCEYVNSGVDVSAVCTSSMETVDEEWSVKSMVSHSAFPIVLSRITTINVSRK